MNLFDGKNGNTDGTSDGPSVHITGDGGIKNIYVSGSFDGATVTLQRFSSTLNNFGDTGAFWDQPDEFQGLIVKPGEKYRLLIASSGGSTNIIAEVV